MKRLAIGLIVTVGFVLGGSVPAHAGEYNGKGGPVPGAENASSACAYSGRDMPDDVEGNPPGFDDDEYTDGHVQSYGILVRAGLKAFVPSPGVACRGNAGFEE